MTRTRKFLAVGVASVALALTTAPLAGANAKPPTNGGNGAGQSGQCTGKASERPASCQSSK